MPKKCKKENCGYNVFGGGYCKIHQYLRFDKVFKPIKTVTKSIKKITKKLRGLTMKYIQLRTVFLKDHPLCEAKLDECTKVATEIHHMKGRGKYLLDDSTFLATCRNCHNWLENHPKLAKLLGFSDSRLNKQS